MPSAGAEIDGSLALLHALPGRARWRVGGLRGNEALRRSLLDGLIDGGEIHRAEASTLTGSVLVWFDAKLPAAAVAARLARLTTGAALALEGGTPQDPAPAPAWHALPPGEVLARLGSSEQGLTDAAARARLSRLGRNDLPPLGRGSAIEMLLGQFSSLPIALLAGAAMLSLATGGLLDAAMIAGVVGLNAAIGFATERKAERIISGLRLPRERHATLRRMDRPVDVANEAVVPGDIMVLRPGMIVAADGRILASDALSIDESMLTGESFPVAKSAAPVARERHLSERPSMVFRGTAVVGGSGTAVVVATGRHTEMGRIQALVGEARPPETPMQRQLGRLGRQLVWLSAATCGGVLMIGWLRREPFLQLLKSSIALAVAAIPEGLPTLATTALALGIEQMGRRGVLVRRLDAIETLAAVNVIAFDKTGTITENRMSVAALVLDGKRLDPAMMKEAPPRGTHLARLLEIAVLCNEARLQESERGTTVLGSPTEAALMHLALGAGIDAAAMRRRWPVRAVGLRSGERHYMVSEHRDAAGRSLLAVKGSPEQVLERCSFCLSEGRRRKLGSAARRHIMRENRMLAEAGLRVLAFAYARPKAAAGAGAVPDGAFTWLGLIGLADPPRHGVERLLASLAGAGIRVLMLTGDQRATAEAVARQVNLGNGEPAARAGADREKEMLAHARIFARVSPAEKLRVVRALQARGKVVAMTGDGINDSPALRAADVGIVMGRGGNDAAREVADIVLRGDDLAAIVAAVEHGRTTYGNIRKAIRYLLATNLSEILVMVAAIAAGMGTPLAPAQLLWINLLSDVLPALGLALEPSSARVLEEAPRDPDEAIVGRRDMARLAREGGAIALGSLGAYAFGLLRHGASPRAGTLAFTSLVGAQLLHALTCRSDHAGLFLPGGQPPNRPLAAFLAASLALQAGLLGLPPLRRFMRLAPLDLVDVLAGIAGAALPYLANEAAKAAPPLSATTAAAADD